jgi:hypothetical protein
MQWPREFRWVCGVDRTKEEKHEESCLPRRSYIASARIGGGGGVEDLLSCVYRALCRNIYVQPRDSDFANLARVV